MNNEFKKTSGKGQTVYTLESATSGGTSSGSIASVSTPLGGMQRRNPPSDNILAQEADKNKVPATTPRNFVAKNAKTGGAGAHKDKSKTIPRKEKHKKPVAEGIGGLGYDAQSLITKLRRDVEEKRLRPTPEAILAAARELAGDMEFAPQLLVQQVLGKGLAEGFNGEYDDEAGMAHSNLLTSARAVIGLLKTIDDRDNLPEWAQEKIAKAEMMLVTVWDYLQSQKAMGNDPQVEGYGRYDRRDAYQRDYDHSVAGMDRGNNHRDDERHDLDPSDWYIVKDGKMFKVSVYPNQEQEAISRGYSRTRDEAKAAADSQGVAEGDGGAKYKIKSIGKDKNGDYYISPSTGKKVYKSGVKRGDHENPKTGEHKGVAEGERTMSRAAKGNEKYGKDGMKALAKAGREGASEKKLDAIRDKHDNYNEEWSKKYKSSINCSHPKGFSQKAHCAGKSKHNESMSVMEMTCEDCGMCQTHGNLNEIKKGAKDSNGYTSCWKGYHAAGTKKSATTGKQVRNCVPNENIEESDEYFNMLERSVSQAQHNLMVGVANNPQFAQQVKVKQQVGQEFAKADVGKDISKLPMRVLKKK